MPWLTDPASLPVDGGRARAAGARRASRRSPTGGARPAATTMAAIASSAAPSTLRRWAGVVAPTLAAGAVAALSLPPWGWWPLGPVGVAVLAWRLAGLSTPGRLAAGVGFGLGLFTPGLWWMGEFHALGAALAVLIETAFVAAAAVATPPGRWRVAALPATLVVAEAGRAVMPFGGVPLAGLGLGQAGGPWAGAARLGGELLLVALVAVAGVGLAALASRRVAVGGAALAVVAATGLAGAMAPDGGDGPGVLDVAVVHGGGRRGFRGVETDPAEVFERHAAASRRLRAPIDLVVWPEDVVDVEGPVARTPEARLLSGMAVRTRATVVAGVVEGAGPDRFRNAAVAWSPDGSVADRYDKVQRVPFGEYVPMRSLLDGVVDLSAIPRDAIAGRGPGLLRTPAGDLGAVISYEVFFARRGRAAARAGAEVLLVPTNAASFSTEQVPSQELTAARLRAIETGRDVVQSAPTGYGAHVDHHGRVLARTVLGRRQVLGLQVRLRAGRTVYVRLGDGPLLGLAVLVTGASWAATLRVSRAEAVRGSG